MPLDPSLSLQVANPNPTNMISGFLNIGQQQINLDKSRATYDAAVSQAKAQSSLANTQANVAAATAAPTISQAQSQAATAATGLNTANLANAKAHFENSAQMLAPLANDPNLTTAKVMDVVNGTLKANGAPPAAYAQAYQGIPNPTGDPVADQAALKQFVTNSLMRAQTAHAQLEKQYPAPVGVSTNKGTQFVAPGNPALTGVAPGTAQGPALLPPNIVGHDVYGNPTTINTASGKAGAITGAPPPGPGITVQGMPNPPPTPGPQMSLPPNETPANLAAMQTQRAAATASVANVGTEHNLNQTIFDLASRTTTGMTGAALTKISNAFGYANTLGATGLAQTGDPSADFNTLGKYLARSTAANAQAMGLPNTNAGTEMSAEASGTTNYDPTTLKRIAILNEGMATGKTIYQQGIENAIKTGGPDAIGAVRDFSAKWGSTFDPTAAALMAAVKSGNKPMQAMIVKEAGGLGSPGVTKLRNEIHAMYGLAGQQ